LFTLSFDAENAQSDDKWDGLYEGFVIPDTRLTNRWSDSENGKAEIAA
jgi:hypothetical protein